MGLATRAEAVQTNFALVSLGLTGCQSISNDVLRSELGIEKLSSRWEKLRLGYWRRINVAAGDRTLVALATMRRAQLLWGYRGSQDGWMSTKRDLLLNRGHYKYWADPTLCAGLSKERWKEELYEAVEGAEDAARR